MGNSDAADRVKHSCRSNNFNTANATGPGKRCCSARVMDLHPGALDRGGRLLPQLEREVPGLDGLISFEGSSTGFLGAKGSGYAFENFLFHLSEPEVSNLHDRSSRKPVAERRLLLASSGDQTVMSADDYALVDCGRRRLDSFNEEKLKKRKLAVRSSINLQVPRIDNLYQVLVSVRVPEIGDVWFSSVFGKDAPVLFDFKECEGRSVQLCSTKLNHNFSGIKQFTDECFDEQQTSVVSGKQLCSNQLHCINHPTLGPPMCESRFLISFDNKSNLIIFNNVNNLLLQIKSLFQPFPLDHTNKISRQCSENILKVLCRQNVLPYIQHIFSSPVDWRQNREILFPKSVETPIAIEMHTTVVSENRLDCCCKNPCDVPSSLSVVDATAEEKNFEDTEVLSSGDELDKLESDTDSQDTVIEGEAYKRMRSVAIKEKILHANEELFGIPLNPVHRGSDDPAASDIASLGHIKMSDILPKVAAQKRIKNDTSVISKCDRQRLEQNFNSEESTKFLNHSLVSEDIFNCDADNFFYKYNLNTISSDVPYSNEEGEGHSEKGFMSLSYSQEEKQLYSSESSDNGSDVEEVVLSDTSTSSDEATYIAPAAGFYRHSMPVSYKLHTIIEESCEESDKGSRVATPTSRTSSSHCIHLNGSNLSRKDIRSSLKIPKKVSQKIKLPTVTNQALQESSSSPNHTDLRSKKGPTINAVLAMATTRLENYFRSGAMESNSFVDDDLTDESGGISSDDDKPFEGKSLRFSNKEISSNKASSSARSNHSLNVPMTYEESQDKSPRKVTKFTGSKRTERPKVAYKTSNEFSQQSISTLTSSLSSFLHQKYTDSFKESKGSDLKSDENKCVSDKSYISKSDTENVSDDEAKYIMNHVIKHITNNNESNPQLEPEVNEVSPALKILESEIARLMLTVSPVSLSAGEPSSSCSSTIGSNNSDYGSDTLESCEETTSDEEPVEESQVSNAACAETSSSLESNVTVSSSPARTNFLEKDVTVENPVTDETLYICKQLVASLKKIADSAEANMVSDELSKAEADDNTAKQYITDQIVSLMQTVNASQNNSPLIERSFACLNMATFNMDLLSNQDRSDSDSPQPHDEKRGSSKSKTPSESGSETTISASISIPSYDDSDRTPTESEISHEMDELYALLESNSSAQESTSCAKFYDADDSPPAEGEDSSWYFRSCTGSSLATETESSLLFGAASKLESLLPISIEERIAMYNNAFINKDCSTKADEAKDNKMRINVILPQPVSSAEVEPYDNATVVSDEQYSEPLCERGCVAVHLQPQTFEENGVTSVKIISHNHFSPSTLVHQVLPSNKLINNIEDSFNSLDSSSIYPLPEKILAGSDEGIISINGNSVTTSDTIQNKGETSTIVTPLPKVINPKEKASSENDLLVANYRAKSKNSKVFGTKSAGNISELENIGNKTAFRDTGYYSLKSSDESFLSLDDSTTSRTSTTSLTQYRSLTSTETIPEEEESNCKCASPTKISLSSGNIPFEVCGAPASKSSTLPLSLRGKLSSAPGGSHRTRSSFFSTSGVLRKLTLLRDESGNSLRSSPHGRMRIRHRTLSGGSEDGRQARVESLPQISVSTCSQPSKPGTISTASSEKDSLGHQDDDIDQVFAYHSRSQMSISSFGGRSGSVTSVYSAAGGGRYGTVAVTGEVLFSLNYNYKGGILEVLIKECRNLAPVDTKRNRSDPYVKVYLLPDRTKSGKRKTKVKKHTLNPVFDELLKFQVTISELERRTLWLSVWHSDRFGRNDFLGEVMLPLGHDSFENSELKWHSLQERLETLDAPVSYKGDLILALKYVPPDVTTRRPTKKVGDQPKGALHVLVKEARNLMATRSNGTSDPFCKSYLLPDKSKSGKQKTPVLKKTCNPKWNHTFVYEDVVLDELRERCLELTIWDYDKITSNDFLGGVRLCLGTGKYQNREVDWMDSIGEEVSLWYTMLDRPNMWVDGSLLLRPSMQNRKLL